MASVSPLAMPWTLADLASLVREIGKSRWWAACGLQIVDCSSWPTERLRLMACIRQHSLPFREGRGGGLGVARARCPTLFLTPPTSYTLPPTPQPPRTTHHALRTDPCRRILVSKHWQVAVSGRRRRKAQLLPSPAPWSRRPVPTCPARNCAPLPARRLARASGRPLPASANAPRYCPKPRFRP